MPLGDLRHLWLPDLGFECSLLHGSSVELQYWSYQFEAGKTMNARIIVNNAITNLHVQSDNLDNLGMGEEGVRERRGEVSMLNQRVNLNASYM